jgi:polygalacturonase
MRTPFVALLISTALASAYGQDTRRVTEPRIPASCTVLMAGLDSKGATLAESDENKPDTDRIQQAMDRCQPGQAVELKAGGGHDAFLSGPLQLRRGVTLLIDKGVILFGSRNPRDYDLVPGLCGTITEKKVPYTPGISGHACKPLIGGDHVAGAAVMGDGIIDGRGGAKMLGQNISWWDLAEQSIKGWPDQYNNWARGVAENPAAFQPLTAPPPGVIGLQNNPRMMILSGCDNFTLYRIQLATASRRGAWLSTLRRVRSTGTASISGSRGRKYRRAPPTSPLRIATFTRAMTMWRSSLPRATLPPTSP